MALVEFYIRNYMANGSLNTTETLFQTIPMEPGTHKIVNPRVKASMGKSGSFSFSLYLDHPLYDSLLQYKTKMRVVYAGHTLFRGRVITIDKQPFDHTRTVSCEGVFSYLLDSHQPGTKEDTRPTISVNDYLRQIIAQHNRDVEAEKQITLGEVPGQYTNATSAEQRIIIPTEKAKQQFGSSSWNTSMDRLEDLLNDFGGYMRIRYENGINYLDWVDKYYNSTVNPQAVAVASNLIDLGGTSELENLFTVVVPIGKNGSESVYLSEYWPVAVKGHAQVNYIEVPELATRQLLPDIELNRDYHRKSDYAEAISKYGKIWKTVDFENANTPEKLFRYVLDWIKDNYMPELTQWSVTAVDLKIPGESDSPLIVGDRVTLTHPEVEQRFESFTIIEADYDLYSMDKTKYTIGIPNQQLNASYGVAQKQQKSGKSSGSGKPSKSKNVPNEDEINREMIKNHLESQYSLKTDWKQDIQLDDPLAFLIYDNNLAERDEIEVAKDTAMATAVLERTKKQKFLELRAEAERRGCAWDDPQLLIDFTPSLSQKQQQWKAQAEAAMYSEYGLTSVQANVLLNSSAGGSWLAALVDDDGEWTEKAYEEAVTGGVAGESLRQRAIQTRKLLQGERVQNGTGVVNTSMPFLTGTGLNVDDIINTSVIEDAVNDAKKKAVDFLSGNFNIDIEKPLSDAEDWFKQNFNFGGGLFTGGSETKSSGDETSFMDWLNGFLHGGTDKPSAGGETNVLDILGGLFSGGTETKASGEKNAFTDLINGLFSGGKDIKQNGSEKGFFDMLGGLFSGEMNLDNLGEYLNSKFKLTSDTANIDGENGTAQIGKDQNNAWRIKLNDTITYQDEDGQWVTASGFVTAEDFHLREVPSFKTKLAVIDTLFVGVVYTNELEAVEAKIDHITADTVQAGSFVRCANGYFGDVSLIGNGGNGAVTAKSYKYRTDDETINLEDCFDSAQFRTESSEPGKIYLDLWRANGAKVSASFNMASTQYFIDSVGAAWNSGGSTARAYIANSTITSNGTYTVKGQYKKSGETGYTDSGHNQSITVNVSAPSVEISIPTVEPSDGKPSYIDSYTDTTRINNYLRTTTRSYIYFQVSAGGATRWYRITTPT